MTDAEHLRSAVLGEVINTTPLNCFTK